jgi:hypothetical protein
MKKAFAVAGLLLASSFALGVALLAPNDRPASAAVSRPSEPVPALDVPPPPVVLETSAVLVVAPRPQEAPKARPVAARPRPKAKGLVDCGNAKVRTYETTALGTGVTYCHN